MIVQFGHPSPWHVGQSSRRLYSARAVGGGARAGRGGGFSFDTGPTASFPFSFAASATRSAAFIAAYGDASSFAALTTMPPVAFVIVSEPVMSVSVMMMLLYDAKMWATPQRGMIRPPSARRSASGHRVRPEAGDLHPPHLPRRAVRAAVPSAGPDASHSRSRSARRT